MNCAISITPHGNKEQDVEFFRQIKNAGFTHIGIEFNKSDWLKDDDWTEKVDDLSAAISEEKMSLSAAHLCNYPLSVGVSVKYPETEELIKRSALAAAKIGAPLFIAHLRSSIDQNFSKDVAAVHNKADFLPILEIAEKANAGIVFENMPVFADFDGHKYFSSNPSELLEFIESFSSDSVGICWDTGHAHMMYGQDEIELMKTASPKIKLVEINNNWVRFDSHVLPSAGSIDWNRVCSAISDLEYDGDLLLNVKPAKVPEIADAYYAHAYDCMKTIRERIEKA